MRSLCHQFIQPPLHPFSTFFFINFIDSLFTYWFHRFLSRLLDHFFQHISTHSFNYFWDHVLTHYSLILPVLNAFFKERMRQVNFSITGFHFFQELIRKQKKKKEKSMLKLFTFSFIKKKEIVLILKLGIFPTVIKRCRISDHTLPPYTFAMHSQFLLNFDKTQF